MTSLADAGHWAEESQGREIAMLIVFAAWSDQIAQYLEGLLGLDADYIVAVLRIIGINIVLSGDNAIVIALACRTLPPRQRVIGIILGAGAAVILRIIFTIVVQQLFDVPWLKLIGGLILLWIAVKLLLGEDSDESSVRSGGNVWEAVKIVAIADIVMSLDNVLAIAAAAGGNTNLIIFGLVISIPLVVFGSTLLVWVLDHVPILVWAGSALLGWVAGELIATEPVLQPYLTEMAGALGVSTKFITRTIETSAAVLVVLVGWLILKASRARREAKQPAE
jgi:YjbE family integral membrane protein